jgi:hypothetical protein
MASYRENFGKGSSLNQVGKKIPSKGFPPKRGCTPWGPGQSPPAGRKKGQLENTAKSIIRSGEGSKEIIDSGNNRGKKKFDILPITHPGLPG